MLLRCPAPSNRVITTNGASNGHAGAKEDEAEAAGPGGGAAAKSRSPKASGGAPTVNDEEKVARNRREVVRC